MRHFPWLASAGWIAIRYARAHDFERVLNQFHAGEINLLVGTQMIAKRA